MKKLTLLMILAVLMFCSATVLADSSFGYVNLEQLLKQSIKLQKIEKDFDAYERQVIADFEKEKAGLSNEDAKIRAVAFQEDILMREQMAASRLDANIRTAIKIVAKKLSLDLVVNNNVAYYGGKDITIDVIKTIDAGQD